MSKYYIVNEFDRPCEDLIAEEIGGRLYYIRKDLRARYSGMPTGRATRLEDFGLTVSEKGNFIHCKIERESVAKYADGRKRSWQGRRSFTIKKEVE